MGLYLNAEINIRNASRESEDLNEGALRMHTQRKNTTTKQEQESKRLQACNISRSVSSALKYKTAERPRL